MRNMEDKKDAKPTTPQQDGNQPLALPQQPQQQRMQQQQPQQQQPPRQPQGLAALYEETPAERMERIGADEAATRRSISAGELEKHFKPERDAKNVRTGRYEYL